MTEVSIAELARRLCIEAHPFTSGPVPCGQHQQQATSLLVLTRPEGDKAWRVLLQARREAERD